jgi:hypothetical protein
VANAIQVTRIRAASEEIQAVPIEQLVANAAKWGVYTFDKAKGDLELIFSLSTHLRTLPIEIIPDHLAEQIAVVAERTRDTLKTLAAFDPRQGNPNEMVEQLSAQVAAGAQELLVQTQSWIPFLAYQRGDVQRNIEQMRRAVDEARGVLDGSRTYFETTKREIDGIVVAAREASASAGVGVFTADFSAQATKLETAAKGWLQTTAGFGIATLLVAFFSAFFGLDANASNAHVLQYMTSKLVLLLVLLTATVWCGRLYKASMHQAAGNHHRANALKTFQAFIKAASDDQTRDAVLMETTRSIFAITPSGYLESSEPAVDTGTKVLEIFKGSRAGT